ncbi:MULTISPECIES: serine hydrolase domain-containing protein [Oceanobacillus]|uniref:Serine hydrolase domain-containing protein n=1 Tax=Oceanobacillus aidingensis TaxID=645964 RepID=A0ABV9K0Q7_9BACI|nr:serine hydrolase domain-containing protein [Oceanobacillus oncorhynchi]MDM8101917.1 serine hydrolase domain-containing protein [Oceanobacillus oncorhynchi]
MIKRISIFLHIVFFSLCFPYTFSAAENTTPSGIPIEELEQFVDEYAEEYIGSTVAGAAIIAIKDNQIVLSKGYGYADVENQIPMNPDTTVLEWGSITKLFVWVSAMQLAEQGELDLEEDIRTYLPEEFLTKLNYDDPITILNLMHHNAGFEEYIFDLLFESPEQLVDLEESLKLAEPEQVYKPGEVVAYSNYSTSLAAYIIEEITGQPFYDYVNEHIFDELEMNHSTMHLPVEDNQEITRHKGIGYFPGENGDFMESQSFYISMYPSGGINGTAADLAKFAQALMPSEPEKTSLFQEDQTLQKLLTTSYAPEEGVPGLAHGFWEYDGEYRGLTHSGNTVAYSSNMQIVPEDNFAIVILTNQADEIDLLFGLTDELVGRGDQTVRENLPPAAEVEGSYLSARRTFNGFMNLYAYLAPLDVKPMDDNEIELDLAGFKATYVQTSPYVYKLKSGDDVFIPSNVMYFHVNDGMSEQISTAYADYLPMDKNTPSLLISLGLFIWCMVYFLISPFVLMVLAFFRRRRKRKKAPIAKWNWLLMLSGTLLAVNIAVLIIRMLSNPMRTYSELLPHFIGNYLFTATSIIAVVMMILVRKKAPLSKMQKTGYLLTGFSSILFIIWLIIWQMYA